MTQQYYYNKVVPYYIEESPGKWVTIMDNTEQYDETIVLCPTCRGWGKQHKIVDGTWEDGKCELCSGKGCVMKKTTIVYEKIGE